MTSLFTCNFASNNLLASDGFEHVFVRGGEMELIASPSWNTAYALKCTPEQTRNCYGYRILPDNTDEVAQSFYFDPNTLNLTNGDYLYLMAGFDYTTTVVFRVRVRLLTGVYYVHLRQIDDAAANQDTGSYAISDQPHCIEVRWKAATGPGANNGYGSLYVDGFLKETKGSVDSDTKRVSWLNLGSVVSGVFSPVTGSAYYGNWKATDDAATIVEGAPNFLNATVGTIDHRTLIAYFSNSVLASNYATGVTIKVNNVSKTFTATRQATTNIVYYYLTDSAGEGTTVTWEYNAAVGDYTDTTSTYPMATTGALSVVNSVVIGAFNIEVPIQMIQEGIYSLAAAAAVANFSKINFDESNYDGATYYWEIVATNNHAANNYDVQLYDVTNSAVLSTLTVVANQTGNTRQRSAAFAFGAGNNVIAINCPQTEVNGNVLIRMARIIVVQADATKTRIQIPLCNKGYNDYDNSNYSGYVDSTTSASYTQNAPENYGLVLKNEAMLDAIAAGNSWSLEGVIRSNLANTGYVGLFNATDNVAVTGAEISIVGGTVTLVTAQFANNAANFDNGDNFEIRAKASAGGTVYFNNVYLYVTLDTLTKAEVTYTVGFANTGTTGSSLGAQRMLYTPANFTYVSAYAEYTGHCEDNGNAQALREWNSNVATGAVADITGSPVNWNSATKARWRSGAITPTSAWNIYFYREATTNTSYQTWARLVIDVDNS